MNPTHALQILEPAWPSMAINWEAVLAAQYRATCPHARCMVDVGANLGAHVAQFVEMGCPKILAFEPIPELASRLATLYQGGPVTVYQVALGESQRQAMFYIDTEVFAESGLRCRVDRPDRVRRQIQVEVETLDSLALDAVDFIKIDAEGADLLVLSGAGATIGRCRPLISVEYGWAGYHTYGLPKEALGDWAARHHYSVCDLFGGAITRDLYDACIDRYYWDYFLVPDENRDLASRLEQSGEAVLGDIERFTVRVTDPPAPRVK
jgi:FkbM family methyltransferase